MSLIRHVGVRQGENLSPLLFSINLNDFADFISTEYPGLMEMNILCKSLFKNKQIDMYFFLLITFGYSIMYTVQCILSTFHITPIGHLLVW